MQPSGDNLLQMLTKIVSVSVPDIFSDTIFNKMVTAFIYRFFTLNTSLHSACMGFGPSTPVVYVTFNYVLE